MFHHIKFSWVYISNQLISKESLTLSRIDNAHYPPYTISLYSQHLLHLVGFIPGQETKVMWPVWPGTPLLVITQHQEVVLVVTALLPRSNDAETSHTLYYFVRCNNQFLEHKQLCSTSQIVTCHTLRLNYKWFCKILRVHSSKAHNKVFRVEKVKCGRWTALFITVRCYIQKTKMWKLIWIA